MHILKRAPCLAFAFASLGCVKWCFSCMFDTPQQHDTKLSTLMSLCHDLLVRTLTVRSTSRQVKLSWHSDTYHLKFSDSFLQEQSFIKY
jgi:hypothetical protein